MQAGWLKGKVHPVTGEPLRIKNLALPKGSLVCFPHHMPHSVTPINRGTRWGQLLTYRTIDETRAVRSSDRSAFDDWVAHARAAGEISAVAATMFAEF